MKTEYDNGILQAAQRELTSVYNQNSVAIHDCGYSVSNADNGTGSKVLPDDLLNDTISLRIY